MREHDNEIYCPFVFVGYSPKRNHLMNFVHLSAGELVAEYKGGSSEIRPLQRSPEMFIIISMTWEWTLHESGEAAYALDSPTQKERNKENTRDDNDWFLSWVPFIRLGR